VVYKRAPSEGGVAATTLENKTTTDLLKRPQTSILGGNSVNSSHGRNSSNKRVKRSRGFIPRPFNSSLRQDPYPPFFEQTLRLDNTCEMDYRANCFLSIFSENDLNFSTNESWKNTKSPFETG